MQGLSLELSVFRESEHLKRYRDILHSTLPLDTVDERTSVVPRWVERHVTQAQKAAGDKSPPSSPRYMRRCSSASAALKDFRPLNFARKRRSKAHPDPSVIVDVPPPLHPPSVPRYPPLSPDTVRPSSASTTASTAPSVRSARPVELSNDSSEAFQLYSGALSEHLLNSWD